ncbi:SUR7/PalI family-domain-containing protein [Parachaetomium inaequale]|uniref:SUR7/PalI family-domain-containing protein n=1 Tax=Parachaetomium inaequale TaxID=2588326 RepID=A0AAN6SQ11_9PEZI|nr:SUR7/PalI family-domain-containing protein [Parachaetomium inaequale]
MANFGRFVCVLVPFLLTLASLVAMLIAGLAGIADKSLYMFRVNVTDLSISPLSVSGILNGTGLNIPTSLDDINVDVPNVDIPDIDIPDIDIPDVDISVGKRQTQTTNITAADLGLYDVYDVNMWNYCYTKQDGTRECTKGAFDWAAHALNTTTGDFNSMLTSTGLNVTLPSGITDAVKAFGTVSKWTQVVFIIASVTLGVELFFGLFANCSRAFSCVTWLIAFLAILATGAAAALATATSVIVVGAVEASSELYGIDAQLNTRFLAAVWISVAFAIAAGLFWMFTICCCKPDHSSRRSRSRHGDEAEKFIPAGNGGSGYSRLGEPSGYARQSYGPAQQHSGAYEPYSHARV